MEVSMDATLQDYLQRMKCNLDLTVFSRQSSVILVRVWVLNAARAQRDIQLKLL